MSLKSIIATDKKPLIHCMPSDFIDEAMSMMIDAGRNAVAVMERGNQLRGILTDHDIIRAVHDAQSKKQDIAALQIQDWMTSKVITCSVDTKLTESLSLMGKHKIRHLVVTEADRAIAIVSIRDVLSQIHHNDELEVNVLRDMALASRGIIAA